MQISACFFYLNPVLYRAIRGILGVSVKYIPLPHDWFHNMVKEELYLTKWLS